MDDKPLRARISLATRDAAAAQAVAERLAGLGFTGVAAGARGVSFEGDARDFERVFKTPVVQDQRGARFAGEPALAELFGPEVDSMYFPSKPSFFDR